MKYLVVYYESYVGYHFDEFTFYFDNKAEAKAYCKELNEAIAKVEKCKVKNLGDFYEVVEINKVTK